MIIVPVFALCLISILAFIIIKERHKEQKEYTSRTERMERRLNAQESRLKTLDEKETSGLMFAVKNLFSSYTVEELDDYGDYDEPRPPRSTRRR